VQYDELRTTLQRLKDERHDLEAKQHELEASRNESDQAQMQHQHKSELANVCSADARPVSAAQITLPDAMVVSMRMGVRDLMRRKARNCSTLAIHMNPILHAA
jgi:hypothetical protein